MTVAVWTPELKAEAISEYVDRINELPEEERPLQSLSIIADLAAAYGFTQNSMRGVIQQSPHYVKAAKKEAASKSGTGTGTKRPNKPQALADLKAAIADTGNEVNDELVEKLTAIQAVYFTAVIRAAQGV